MSTTGREARRQKIRNTVGAVRRLAWPGHGYDGMGLEKIGWNTNRSGVRYGVIQYLQIDCGEGCPALSRPNPLMLNRSVCELFNMPISYHNTLSQRDTWLLLCCVEIMWILTQINCPKEESRFMRQVTRLEITPNRASDVLLGATVSTILNIISTWQHGSFPTYHNHTKMQISLTVVKYIKIIKSPPADIIYRCIWTPRPLPRVF